jgi:hypothetical protein
MITHMRALARRYRLLGCGFRRHGLARRQSGAIAVKKVDQVVDDTPGFSKHGIFTDFLNVIGYRDFLGVLHFAIADDHFLILLFGFYGRGSVAI